MDEYMSRGKGWSARAAAAGAPQLGDLLRVVPNFRNRVKASFEALEQVFVERRIRFGQLVVIPLAVLPRGHESRAAQVRQVTRRRGLWNVQDVHEIAHAQFPVEQQVQNAQPRTIGKCAKHQINLRFRHGSVYSLARLYFANFLTKGVPFEPE
jgi:hypothetical protein